MVFLDSTRYHLLTYLIYVLRRQCPQYLSASILHGCTFASLDDIFYFDRGRYLQCRKNLQDRYWFSKLNNSRQYMNWRPTFCIHMGTIIHSIVHWHYFRGWRGLVAIILPSIRRRLWSLDSNEFLLSKSLRHYIVETFLASLTSTRLRKNPLFEVIYHFTARLAR